MHPAELWKRNTLKIIGAKRQGRVLANPTLGERGGDLVGLGPKAVEGAAENRGGGGGEAAEALDRTDHGLRGGGGGTEAGGIAGWHWGKPGG